jgi:hypothetical protein
MAKLTDYYVAPPQGTLRVRFRRHALYSASFALSALEIIVERGSGNYFKDLFSAAPPSCLVRAAFAF